MVTERQLITRAGIAGERSLIFQSVGVVNSKRHRRLDEIWTFFPAHPGN